MRCLIKKSIGGKPNSTRTLLQISHLLRWQFVIGVQTIVYLKENEMSN